MDENELTYLPPDVSFYYYNLNFNFFFNQIGSCSQISLLSMRENKLNYLPDEIGRLSRLKVLNLSANMLQFLPYSISKLKELQALWLSENQVRNKKIF